MWNRGPENILNYSRVAMVIKIIDPHGDKVSLVSKLITHEENGQLNVFNSLFYQWIHITRNQTSNIFFSQLLFIYSFNFQDL